MILNFWHQALSLPKQKLTKDLLRWSTTLHLKLVLELTATEEDWASNRKTNLLNIITWKMISKMNLMIICKNSNNMTSKLNKINNKKKEMIIKESENGCKTTMRNLHLLKMYLLMTKRKHKSAMFGLISQKRL